jgi:hypothetical protein
MSVYDESRPARWHPGRATSPSSDYLSTAAQIRPRLTGCSSEGMAKNKVT